MDSTALGFALSEPSLTGLGIGMVVGVLFSFNPASFAATPMVLAYVTRAHTQPRALLLAGAFIAGMVLTHTILGAAAAMGGEWVKGVMDRAWWLILGPLLIALGLIWAGWLKIDVPWVSVRGHKVTDAWGALLLGIPFSVAFCPACAPTLLVLLTAALSIGSVPFAVALLLAFAVGRSVPILLGAWGIGWLESLGRFTAWEKRLELGGGITLILVGVYLFYSYLFSM